MHCFAVLNSPSGLLHKPVLISPIWKTEYQDIFPLGSLIIKATLALPEQEDKSTISLFLQIFYFGSCGNLCFASVRVDHWAKQWLARAQSSAHRSMRAWPPTAPKTQLYSRPWPQALKNPTWSSYLEGVRPLNFSNWSFLKFQSCFLSTGLWPHCPQPPSPRYWLILTSGG